MKRENGDNPTVSNRERETAPEEWHETGKLPDGTPVGNMGASWYVLNEEGEPISKGYHEIHPVQNGYVGKVGACWYKITPDGSELKQLSSKPTDDELITDGGQDAVEHLKHLYIEGSLGEREFESRLERVL